VGAQPVGRKGGEGREGVAHRLRHELDPIQRAAGGQHVSRVRPLPPPRLEQPAVAGASQQQVEQPAPGAADQQTGAELAQDRMVEARIRQLERQGILPVEAAAHRLGRRAVREVLDELEDRDQSQPPGGFGRPAPRREQVGEVLITVDGVQF
jgi:hypothetical protein